MEHYVLVRLTGLQRRFAPVVTRFAGAVTIVALTVARLAPKCSSVTLFQWAAQTLSPWRRSSAGDGQMHKLAVLAKRPDITDRSRRSYIAARSGSQ